MNIKARRIVAAFIDFYIGCFAATSIIVIITLGKLNVTPITVSVYFIAFFVIMSLRDLVFKNASVGKKLLKIKVVKEEETKFTAIDALKRIVPCLMLPVEIFMLIVNERRIGDIWAKTIVVLENSN